MTHAGGGEDAAVRAYFLHCLENLESGKLDKLATSLRYLAGQKGIDPIGAPGDTIHLTLRQRALAMAALGALARGAMDDVRQALVLGAMDQW